MTKKKIPEGFAAARVEFIAPADVVEKIMAAINDPELAKRLSGDPHMASGPPWGKHTVAAMALLQGVEALQACYYPEPFMRGEDRSEPQVHLDLPVFEAACLHHWAEEGHKAGSPAYDSCAPESAAYYVGSWTIEHLGHVLFKAGFDKHTWAARMRSTGEAEEADRLEDDGHGERIVEGRDAGGPRHFLKGKPVYAGATLEIRQGGHWPLVRYEWCCIPGQPAWLHFSDGPVIEAKPEYRYRWPGDMEA